MTDKIQKIREGIERLKSQLIKGACASQIAMETRCKEEAYNEVLAILDTMQEEPVNNPINFEQELYKAFGQVKDFTLGVRIAKRFYDMGKKSREPVSEDLKKAAENYAFTMSGEDEVLKYDAFIEGAKWQKQKDSMPVSEDLEEAVNAYIGYAPEVDECSSTYGKRQAFKAGAQWQKKQTMAKAIDAKLLEGHLIRQKGVTHPLHVGDKVKVIVIKED